jgi:serine/threonine protein kinase/tetratricopeptide (TPR) repeat protein
MLNVPAISIEIATKVRKIGPLEPLEIIPPPEKRSHLLQVGTLINARYRVEEVLGEGGMGVIYHVSDLLHPERSVALKNISGRGIESIEIDLFKSEFKLMSELHHPNVAAVYDFEALAGTHDYFFTMELVHGTNILDATERKDWRQVVDLLVPLCRALSYVHSRGIIHFDIKPANILVDDIGVIKVLDFGVAGLKKLSSEKFIGGTAYYMAPELSTGDFVDHRADLYSLGILIYRLLCRDLPFKGPFFLDLIKQHQQSPLVWSKEAEVKIPGWLRAIVERLCAKNPADRFRTANNVIEVIDEQGGFSYELETQKTKESYIFSSRFVGREKEFDEITHFIDSRFRGEAVESLLFVSGQSGIGKSRLFREVRSHSQLAQVLFIEGNCYEGRFSEYGAIAELVSYLLPLVEAAGQRGLILQFGPELAKIEPQLIHQYQLAPSPPLNRPEAEHLRLREQVSEFFVRVADVMPYTIYLNDLQWAPSGTADLLYYLAWRIILRGRQGESCPIAILGSFRGDEVEGRPLEKLLTRLRRDNGFRMIELSPLSSKSIEPLLCSMLGVNPLPSAFVDRVIRETAGNPYFIEEVMRTLVENGSVYIEHGQWATTTEIQNLDIPSSISDVFLRRASLLSSEQRQIVDLLAVGDRPTPIDVITKIAPLTGETLQGILATLERKQMVKTSTDGREYHLSHDRMREALYGAIESKTRLDLHRKFGETLEELFSKDLSLQLGALAYHFTQAKDRTKSLRYSIAAGHDARERYANDFAIRMYEQALPLLDPSDGRARYEIQQNLADVYRMAGRYDDASNLLKELLPKVTDYHEKARLHRLIGWILFERSNLRGAIDELWSAIEMTGEKQPRSRFSMMLGILGGLLVQLSHLLFPRWIRKPKSDQEKALYLERCGIYAKLTESYWFRDYLWTLYTMFRTINYGEHVGDSKDLCFMYSGMMCCVGTLRFYRIAEKYGIKSIQMAERLDSNWHRGEFYIYHGILSLFMGRWMQALEEFKKGRDLMDKCGDYFEISITYNLGFYALLYLGRLQEARKWAEEGISLCQRTKVKGMSLYLTLYTLANAYLGQWQGISDKVQKGMKIAEKDTHDLFSRCLIELAVSESLLAVGDAEGAMNLLEHVKEVREKKKLQHYWFVAVYPLLVRAHLEKLRRECQTPSHEELKNLKKLVKMGNHQTRGRPNVVVPCLIASAMLAWTEGDKKKARHSFTEAIQQAEKQGAMLYLAQAHYEAGRAYLQGDTNDHTRAKEHLLAASDAFKACGAVPLHKAAQALLNSATFREVQT